MRPKLGTRFVGICAMSAALCAGTALRAQDLARRFQPVPDRIQATMPDYASAARVNHSWDALVAHVTVGRRVTVQVRDTAYFAGFTTSQGELLAIDDHSITVKEAAPKVIPSAAVMRVGYATHRSRKAFWSGVGVGALIGLALTVADPQHDPDGPVLGAVVFGLPIGGVLAAVFSDRALYKQPATALRASPTR